MSLAWKIGGALSRPLHDTTLDTWLVNRQIGGMTKKATPRRPAHDESQIALSVLEKAIGGKLVDKKNPANLGNYIPDKYAR